MFYYYAIKKSLLSDQDNQNDFTFESNLIENSNKVEDQKKLFNELAFINIKKWETNESRYNNTNIEDYAIEYKEPLRKQIIAIDPDIIFLCGTESAFDKLIDNGEWKKEDGDFKNLSCLNCNKTDSQWFYFFTFKEEKKTRLVINYYHPSFTQRPGWIDVLALQNILRNAKTYMLKHNNDEQFKYLLERLAKTK